MSSFFLYLIPVSVPMRLFNEQEVGEEITSTVPPEKTDLFEDLVLAVYPDVSKKPSLTPGDPPTVLLSETNNSHYLESCVDLMSFDSPVSTKKL